MKGPYAEDAEQRAETELAAVRHSHTALQSQAGCHVLKNIKLTFIYTPEYSSSPKALPMVSLTNTLRNFKRTDLSLSRFMAVWRGILI